MEKRTSLVNEKGAISWVWLVVLLAVAAGVGAVILFLPKPQAPEPPLPAARTKIKVSPIIKPPEMPAAPHKAVEPEAMSEVVSSETSAETMATEALSQEPQIPPVAVEVASEDSAVIGEKDEPASAVEDTDGSDEQTAAEVDTTVSDQTGGMSDEAEVQALLEKATAVEASPPVASTKPSAVETTSPAVKAAPKQLQKLPRLATPGMAAAPAKSVTEKQPSTTGTTGKESKVDSNASAKPAPFTIQLGAFRTEAYAENLLAKLVKRGYAAFIAIKRDADDHPLYLVRYGRYATREEAVRTVNAFKEKENLTAAVALSLSK